MKPFEYYEPASLAEASDLLRRLGKDASIIAGGTDLLVEMKEELRSVLHLVNIKKIPNLRDFTYDPAAGLRFGALVTVREIETSPHVIGNYPNLAKAVSSSARYRCATGQPLSATSVAPPPRPTRSRP